MKLQNMYQLLQKLFHQKEQLDYHHQKKFK